VPVIKGVSSTGSSKTGSSKTGSSKAAVASKHCL
jgi:hypothetical protein